MTRRPFPKVRWTPVLLTLTVAVLSTSIAGNGQETDPRVIAADGSGRDAYINFSFDEVDIPIFARLVGELTGRKFVVSDDVTSKLTVISPRIRREEAYPLFVSIIESAGCSVVEDGDVYRIVSLPAPASPMAPVVGIGEDLPADGGIVTKIFRLEHVSAAEVRKLIEPKVRGGKSGAVGVVEETNHLVVTDTAPTIARIARIIEEIDRPGLARVTEIVSLQFADADQIANELNDSMQEADSRGDQLRQRLPAVPDSPGEANRRAVVVASAHANRLMLVGSAAQIEALKSLIAQMDIDAPSGHGRLNAIFLKYIKADEAAVSLKALLKGNGADATAGPSARSHAIVVEPSPENNALLVDASPGDFNVVRDLVNQLDRVPQQVHIEVLIAELTVGDSFDIGVDMAAVDLPAAVGDNVIQGASTLGDGSEGLLNSIQQGIFPGGLTVGVAHGTRVDAAGNVVVGYPGVININAVKRDARFRIRSNPSLMAQNNREASVSIVNEIPILTSTIQGGSGTSRDVIQNIERIDVGIKLKLTPHIIEGGEVRMELNPSIEAVIDSGDSSQGLTPTIAKREVFTTVTVRDGEVIVIAGLTREDETHTVRRVPILGSIPLLGWLFRHKSEGLEKTNVLVFVKPTIVGGGSDSAALVERLSSQTGLKYDEEQR
jgi:general secretion pathway protein D